MHRHLGYTGCPWYLGFTRDVQGTWDAVGHTGWMGYMGYCPTTPMLPQHPQLSPVGVEQGLRCCWRPLSSMFSKLPASRSLEEDLPLSQGVTASRDLPNLYLHCNLYLSCSVYSC